MSYETKLPLVFVFDLDGTIIGESLLQACRYDLHRALREKPDTRAIMYEMENGLIRPHFQSFVKAIKSTYSNAEFFVYTAAETKWANTIISLIEKNVQIKFNRPIFSRTSCVLENGLVKKCLNKITPVVFRKLKNKYNLHKPDDLRRQLVLIDNTHVVGPHDVNRFVKCPTYDFFMPCDVLAHIPQRQIKNNLPIVANILSKYNITSNMKEVVDPFKLLCYYYASLAEYYKMSSSIANKTKKESDRFWLVMERVFTHHHVKSFNKKVVAYINKKVNGR